ncbi:unnamed protein product [Larinioides sclopetarius]|uniref:Uncharacterized protein n=1 Tax=Larinioides sclopetarius TaxID=280406 RepID=A0AAV2AB24_9ARAC
MNSRSTLYFISDLCSEIAGSDEITQLNENAKETRIIFGCMID